MTECKLGEHGCWTDGKCRCKCPCENRGKEIPAAAEEASHDE